MIELENTIKDDIKISDIFWDRIYLHIRINGENIYDKEYAIATRKEKYIYPITLNGETNEFVINITNVADQEMLCNGNWYIKYLNVNYDEEMAAYEEEVEKYEAEFDEEEENPEDMPIMPCLWKDIPVDIKTCYKLQDLDKIFRYSSNNYAYIFSFSPQKIGDELICAIQSTYMVKHMRPEKRVFKSESKKLKSRWKKRLIYGLEKMINGIYWLASHLSKKNGKRILLMSETRDMGGNLLALDKRLKERGLDEEFKISYHFYKTLEQSRAKIFFVWLKLAFVTARQDFIFVDDYVPFFKYINLHSKTKLIQVWHAGVGFKSVGYARFGKKGSPYPFASSHRKYNYAIVGGEALRDVYAEVFGINRENCLPYGLMRIDGYMDQDKIEKFKTGFYQKYSQFVGKKIILFAPTFRGNGQRTAYYPYDILEQKKIYDMCGEEYVFLIKMHPFILEKIQIEEMYKERIIDFTDFPDINELFYVTDILITDYSSNIYEFSLQKKPIVFFAYDKEEYELIRSVHRTLDKYAPGKVCSTFDELVQTINEQDFEMEKLYRFVEDNFDGDNGRACDKVIDHILLNKMENVEE